MGVLVYDLKAKVDLTFFGLSRSEDENGQFFFGLLGVVVLKTTSVVSRLQNPFRSSIFDSCPDEGGYSLSPS